MCKFQGFTDLYINRSFSRVETSPSKERTSLCPMSTIGTKRKEESQIFFFSSSLYFKTYYLQIYNCLQTVITTLPLARRVIEETSS